MIPLTYFMQATDAQLEGFEMNRRNQVANLEKELKAMRAQLWELQAEADVAAWLRTHRQEIMQRAGEHLDEVIEIVREKKRA